MPEDTDNRETSKKTQNTEATRRSVLGTVMGAGVLGVMGERAEAHAHHAHRVGSVSPFATATQQQTFKTAVDAFNSMNTVAIAQSQLWNVFDPSVVIYDITFDHEKLQGLGPGVANPLQPVVYGLYNLAGGMGLPNFNPWGPPPTYPGKTYGPPDYTQKGIVKGYALWTDSDNTGSEVIHYKFRFNNNLLVEMHGR